jgi:CelD/BcsL family acetyltransferase involved in cellulose biosynthesis
VNLMPGADLENIPLDVRLLDTAAQFVVFREPWLELERSGELPNFFQSYAWCGHVADVLTREFPGTYTPLVAIGTRHGEVVAIWPLSRQKRSGIWQLRSIDDPFGQFSGILFAEPRDANALVLATLNLVRQRRLADALKLDRIDGESPLLAALQSQGATCRGQVGAPALDTRPWPTFAALKASRNKKTMKNLRNAKNRLAKAGAHEHFIELSNYRVGEIVQETLKRRASWLKAKGLTSPPFRSKAHESILGAGEAWDLDRMRVGFELKCDGAVIAQQWGYVHNKRYYAYMSATDPAAIQLSPGRLHLAFVIDDAMNHGVEAIEFLTPASDYKMVWTDRVRTLSDLAMPLSTAGQLHDAIWERSLRRGLKAVFYALPVGLRRRVVPREESSADVSSRDTDL